MKNNESSNENERESSTAKYPTVAVGHTPVPWLLHQDSVLILAPSPRRDGSLAAVVDCATSCDPNMPLAEQKANAEFIMRACNSHDTLSAALAGLVDAWWAEFSEFFGGDAKADAENKIDFENLPAVINARAAIAKAKAKL